LPSSHSRVVLLAQDGPSTRAIYHALKGEVPEVSVILEEPVPRSRVLRRRIKTLGALQAMGQALFMVLVLPLLRWRGRRRIEHICAHYELDLSPLAGEITRVPSVNSEEARLALRRLDPGVVVVNGTRIIRKETLSAVDVPFINTHAGITPLYRGVHGGYWALAEGRSDLVGTTVHLVDLGIDTGGPIAQVTFDVTKQDSFATYPYLHTAIGIPALIRAVRQALDGGLELQAPKGGLDSRLRYHPTLWGYVGALLRKGVK
jgi:folate-dependent phosphoribosylglycinamide formyltransferase PurN